MKFDKYPPHKPQQPQKYLGVCNIQDFGKEGLFTIEEFLAKIKQESKIPLVEVIEDWDDQWNITLILATLNTHYEKEMEKYKEDLARWEKENELYLEQLAKWHESRKVLDHKNKQQVMKEKLTYILGTEPTEDQIKRFTEKMS